MLLTLCRPKSKLSVMEWATCGMRMRFVVLAGLALYLFPTTLHPATAITAEQAEALPQVIEDSTIFYNEELGYRFELPYGFVDAHTFEEIRNHDKQPGESVVYNYARKRMDGSFEQVRIAHMPGMAHKGWLDKRNMNALKQHLPKGTRNYRRTFDWYGLRLPGLHQVAPFEEGDMSISLTAVPLARQAIMVLVAVPGSTDVESRPLLEKILSSVQGETNWELPKKSSND